MGSSGARAAASVTSSSARGEPRLWASWAGPEQLRRLSMLPSCHSSSKSGQGTASRRSNGDAHEELAIVWIVATGTEACSVSEDSRKLPRL